MIYAKLFKDIPIETNFCERFTDGSVLTYRKVAPGFGMLLNIQSNNTAFRGIHRVGDRRRISHNEAFPLAADVVRELPEKKQEAVNVS